MTTNKTTTLFLEQGEFLGGAERFSLDFLHSLDGMDRRGLNVVLVGAVHEAYRAGLENKFPVEEFVFPSVRGNIFYKLWAAFRLFLAAGALWKLARKYKKRRFFTNTPRTHFVLLLSKWFFFTRGKWVVMFHDFTVPKFLVRWIAREADVLIANSVPMRNTLRRTINKADYDKILIVENGIDFEPLMDASPPKEIRSVLVLSRIDPRKGQQYAVEVAEKMEMKYPRVKFRIVGSGVKEDERTMEYERQIQDYVRTRNLSNVTFVSEVDSPFEEIEKADVCLFLPTEAETFGRVAIEGLALGKLVLAFDHTGPREILNQYAKFLDLKTMPLLVDQNSTQALYERLTFFVDRPEKMDVFTSRAREFVQQQFSLEETKKQLMLALSN